MKRLESEAGEKPDLWRFEKEAREAGYLLVAGTDEAGRGPLAGPVAAAAVILPFGEEIVGLDDSKKVSAKRREELYPLIRERAVASAVAFATVEEIEELNILRASQLAMRRAVEALSPAPDFLLIDGNVNDGFPVPAKTVVKGDALSASIAAASIPLSRHSAPSMASRPPPVESMRLSTTWTPGRREAARQAVL